MAITEAFTNTATISTTQYDLPSNSTTISAQTTDGVYQVFIDFSALTATEEYRLRIYEKVTGAGSQLVLHDVIITGAQLEPVYVSPALLLINGWTFTLIKNQGTDRSINWSIRQIA